MQVFFSVKTTLMSHQTPPRKKIIVTQKFRSKYVQEWTVLRSPSPCCPDHQREATSFRSLAKSIKYLLRKIAKTIIILLLFAYIFACDVTFLLNIINEKKIHVYKK
jgi:hypothetical protein